MVDKKVLMGGGAALGVFLLYRFKVAQSHGAQEQANANSAPLAMYSLPVSSGINTSLIAPDISSSTAAGSDPLSQMPTAGGAASMTSPDMTSLLSGLLAQQAQQNTQQILANQNTVDSRALASLDLGPNGGTATLTHSATGTVLNVAPVIPPPHPQHATIDPPPPPPPPPYVYHHHGDDQYDAFMNG